MLQHMRVLRLVVETAMHELHTAFCDAHKEDVSANASPAVQHLLSLRLATGIALQ